MKNKILDRFIKSAPEEEKAGASLQAAPGEQPEAELSLSEDRLKGDIKELLGLFPKLDAKAIPEEVWQRVAEGDSLSAAYCLWMVKRAKEQLHIRSVNNQKSRTAPPPVADKGEQKQFFTRETVKNMPASEVRKHLSAILDSMDGWK